MYSKYFDRILNAFISRWNEFNDAETHHEGYKWRAVQCFQDNWDIEAEDFLKMFTDAVRETSVLIDTGNTAPNSGIKALCKEHNESEFVRQCFRELFSEDSGDLILRQKRMEHFIDRINERITHYYPETHLYPQSMRSACAYMALWRPAENYFYKHKEAHAWMCDVEFSQDIGSGASFSLSTYYRMCDEIVAGMRSNTELMKLLKLRENQQKTHFKGSLNVLAYDLIFCAEKHKIRVGANEGKSLAQILEKAQARETVYALKEENSALSNLINTFIDQPLPNLAGTTLYHKKFGKGTTISLEKDRLKAEFDSKIIAFIFPDCVVQGFIRFESVDLHSILATNTENAQKRKELKEKIAKNSTEINKLIQKYDLA